jgi:hypothetical protein
VWLHRMHPARCRVPLDAAGGWTRSARAPGRHGCDMARATTTRRGTAYAAWAREWRGKVGMEQRLRCLRWAHSDAATQRHGDTAGSGRRHSEWTGRLQRRTRVAVSHSRVSQWCCSMRAWLAGGQQRRCSEPRAGGQRCSRAATHRSATVPRVGLHSVVLGSVTRRVVGCGAPYPWPLDQMARQGPAEWYVGPGGFAAERSGRLDAELADGRGGGGRGGGRVGAASGWQ